MEKNVKVYAKAQNRLALGIVKAYIAMHPDTTLEDLRQHFPNSLNPDSGVKENFVIEGDWQDDKWTGYFIKDDELLVLKDGVKATLVSMWTKPSIEKLLNQAKAYGIEGIKSEDAPSGTYRIEGLEGVDGQPNSSNETDAKVENPMEIYLFGRAYHFTVSDGMSKEEWDNLLDNDGLDDGPFDYGLNTMEPSFVVCGKKYVDDSEGEVEDELYDTLQNAWDDSERLWLSDGGEEIGLDEEWSLDTEDNLNNINYPKGFPDEYKKNLEKWVKNSEYEDYTDDGFQLRSLFDLAVPPAEKNKEIHVAEAFYDSYRSPSIWKIVLPDVDKKNFNPQKLAFITDANTEVECLGGELDHTLIGVVYDGKWYSAEQVETDSEESDHKIWGYETPDFYGFYTEEE